MGNLFETKAYHKSGLNNAETSIKWQAFFVSDKETLWLGSGIYFWEHYEDACWWDGNYKRPVILSAQLRCDKKDFLDLDDREQKDAFINYIDAVIEQGKKNGVFIKSDSDDIIAGGSCNYYKKQKGTRLIRYSFPETSGKPQFCASDSSVASNVKMVSFELNGSYMEVKNEFF